MKFITYLFFVSTLSIAVGCGQQTGVLTHEGEGAEQVEERNSFRNPILQQGPDPWAIRYNDSYYYTHTTGRDLRLWETTRMEDLSDSEPTIIWTPPQGEEYSRHIWAPELHFLDGKWYMYFAATHKDGGEESEDENRRMYVLENDQSSPMTANWELKGKIADATDKWAIDGTVFTLEEENYFIWSGWETRDHAANSGRQQLYIAKMENPWTLEGSRVMISQPDYEWEQNGRVNEGPVVWRNPAGEVFLFYSASGCWTDDYTIGVLRLQENGDPLDPSSWRKHPAPLFQKSEANSVYGTGHNSFFKSPDGTEDWILYHANDNPGEGCGGKRKPRIQEISWNAEGFPILGIPADTEKPLKRPAAAIMATAE